MVEHKVIVFNPKDSEYRGLWDMIKQYCKDKGFKVPETSTIICQYSINDMLPIKIDGIIGIEQVFHIEPLIADNGAVGLRLGSIAYGLALASSCNRIQVHVKDIRLEKMQPLLEKEGFVFLEKTNIFTKLCQ